MYHDHINTLPSRIFALQSLRLHLPGLVVNPSSGSLPLSRQLIRSEFHFLAGLDVYAVSRCVQGEKYPSAGGDDVGIVIESLLGSPRRNQVPAICYRTSKAEVSAGCFGTTGSLAHTGVRGRIDPELLQAGCNYVPIGRRGHQGIMQSDKSVRSATRRMHPPDNFSHSSLDLCRK